MHPRLLVLDEPTSALDPTAAEDVLATLTRLVHDLGLTVLLAEHRLERVVPFADRIALLTGDGGSAGRRAGRPCWPTSPGRAAHRRAGPRGGLVAAAAERARGPAPCPAAARPRRAAGRVPRDRRRGAGCEAHGAHASPTASTVAVRDVDARPARRAASPP